MTGVSAVGVNPQNTSPSGCPSFNFCIQQFTILNPSNILKNFEFLQVNSKGRIYSFQTSPVKRSGLVSRAPTADKQNRTFRCSVLSTGKENRSKDSSDSGRVEDVTRDYEVDLKIQSKVPHHHFINLA